MNATSQAGGTSIARRFQVFGVLFTLVLVCAIAIVSIRASNTMLHSQMDLRGASMARYMAKSSLFYYRNFDLGALEGFVKDITSDPEVAFAVFLDDKGKPLTTASAVPAERDALLVFDHEVRDEASTLLGAVSIGYRKTLFEQGLRTLVAIMVASGAIAVVIAAVRVIFIVRQLIARPLEQAVSVAHRLAEGDLSVRFVARRQDEIGRLLTALEGMRNSFRDAVGTIRESAESVASASKRIATGNAELSSRTEQQAASLEETASSMEELTTTVKQNADHATQANELTAGASQVARRGGEAMSNVVTTMASISEASKRISEIIAVIDAIAFQTNILALNAAVEAARAGEQGRGFAVVASEVRSLAQRAATAATEIKQLIQDSSGRVQAGTRLVEDAGATIEEIVSSVKRVDVIMSEIAAASQEQLAGIAQVARAVTQMDRVTQQNSGIVGESAASAENLATLAQQLTRAVSRFTIDAAAPRSAPATASAPKPEAATRLQPPKASFALPSPAA